MQNFLTKLLPFIFLGIMIVLFAVGIIILSYLLIFGALVGVVLFVIAWIRQRFFPSKKMVKRSGRTIDHR